jgi:hypothetical protein
MQLASSFRSLALTCLAALLASCASVSVRDVAEGRSAQPRKKPAHFYVAPFSLAKANVRENSMHKKAGSLGPEVQEILTRYLVAELSKNLGPATAVRSGAAPRDGGWLITGEILRVNEGNRLARMAIGLGAGGTKMETRVQVRNLPASNPPFLNFGTTGGSNATPGAATNPIPFSSAPTAIFQSTQGVTDDGARTARMIVATIADYMVKHGWLEAGKMPKAKMQGQ